MNKNYILLLLLFLCISLNGCRNTSVNGKLDGMWQLTTIDYTDSISENKKTDKIYYSIQLNLISIRHAKTGNEYLGRFVQTKDSLVIYEFREYINTGHPSGVEGHLATIEELRLYGLNQTLTRFKIEDITHSNMILTSNYARLYFRKF